MTCPKKISQMTYLQNIYLGWVGLIVDFIMFHLYPNNRSWKVFIVNFFHSIHTKHRFGSCGIGSVENYMLL